MPSEVVLGFDPATGTFSLPWWAAAVVAALLVVSFVLAIVRTGLVGLVASVGGSAILLVALWGAWTSADRSAERERAAERRAIEAHAFDLAGRAVAPGSPLACLDGGAGEAVELSCEKTLFATPETVAAATSYVAARIALLSSGADYAARARMSTESVLPGLRRSLESDRFGFVAQVLATNYNCFAEKCDAFVLFSDATRVRANLKDRAFDAFVTRNSAAWPARPVRPATASAPAPNATAGGPSPVPPGFNVPSSASIPPVSIMTAEPSAAASAPVNPPQGGATETGGNPPPAPARRPTARTSQPRPAANAPPPPVQIVPSGATAGTVPPQAQ